MKTIGYSILLAVFLHLVFWGVGIINLNPEDFRPARYLNTLPAEQALLNLIPMMFGFMYLPMFKLIQRLSRFD